MSIDLKNCILCDYPLNEDDVSKPSFNDNSRRITCPICKWYRINAHAIEDIVTYKKDNPSPNKKETRPLGDGHIYNIVANRHLLSSYYFEFYEYYYDSKYQNNYKAYEDICLRVEDYQKILNGKTNIKIPQDNDYEAKIKKFLNYLQRNTIMGEPLALSMALLRAVLYVQSNEQVHFYLQHCVESKYITSHYSASTKIRDVYQSFRGFEIILSLQGYQYITEEDVNSKQIFVAMQFNEENKNSAFAIFNDDQFTNNFEKATGYTLFNISQKHHNNDINDEIIAEIKQSRAVIADLTNSNNGAYFEAGFAKGLGKEVIFICHQDVLEKGNVHFDVNHINIIPWKDKDDLKKQLINRIQATLPILKLKDKLISQINRTIKPQK